MKKGSDGCGVEGEKGGICERRTTKRTSYESAGTSATHAVGMVAISVFFVCVLCAPTHEPTYLSPLTCVLYLCTLRDISSPTSIQSPPPRCALYVSPGICACTTCAHMCFSSAIVSQRLTCPQWQEPYCPLYESYACTPLVICLQMAVSDYHSQLVCLLALSPSTIGDQIAACCLLVTGSAPVFQDIFYSSLRLLKFCSCQL